MFTAFRQSTKSLSSNPVRTTLTTLGIVIGISTVILVLSAGAGFRKFVNNQIASLGTNTLVIATKVPPTTKNRASGPSTGISAGNFNATIAITSLKVKDLEDIKKLGNVSNAYGMAAGQAVASYRNAKKSVMYFGASAARFDADKGTLQDGRFYNEGEDKGAAQVAILGSKIANYMFGQDPPIGKYLRVGTLNFQVIGVYAPRNGELDDAVFIPLFTVQKKLLGIDHIIRCVVQMKNTELADATSEDIREALRRNHDITDPAKDDFPVATQADVLETLNTIFTGITLLLIAIAASSLVVGGVGIMNIMYVVVTERTAEIGLKKALGATNADILSEFLIESILVTVFGGFLGILFGGLLAWILSVVAVANGIAWQFTVPLYAIAIVVGVSGAIGISFGVLPARNASRLDPVEALRYE